MTALPEVLFLGVPFCDTLLLYYLQRLGFSVLSLWYNVSSLGPYIQPHPLSNLSPHSIPSL